MGIEVFVPGKPIGQGAVSFLGPGRPAIHTNGRLLHPWRDSITAATARALFDAGLDEPWDEPVRVEALFVMPRGRTVKRAQPTVTPDLDHLLRGLLDATTKARAVADDARVVSVATRKMYETEQHPPGVAFRMFPEPVVDDGVVGRLSTCTCTRRPL